MTIDDCIRDVVGYEGKYKINIVGEVFNKKGKQLKPCVDFENAYECAKAINGNAQDIYRCLYGKTKTHKKYHYEVVV